MLHKNNKINKELFALLYVLAVMTTVCYAVSITKLNVPSQYVINGTDETEDLILDCQYEVNEQDKNLMLQWFFNEHQIYQWIAGNAGQVFSFMKDNIDPDFKMADGSYRALNILNPSKNLTGVYSCLVITDQSEDEQKANLTIIQPGKPLVFKQTTSDDGNEIGVSCFVEDAYPEPELSIVLDGQKEVKSKTNVTHDQSDGLYDVTTEAILKVSDVTDPKNIDCILQVGNYSRSAKNEEKTETNSTGVATTCAQQSFMGFAVLPLTFYYSVNLFN